MYGRVGVVCVDGVLRVFIVVVRTMRLHFDIRCVVGVLRVV